MSADLRSHMEPGSDACGVGFVARLGAAADRTIVDLGLDALRRLAHRGAPPSLGAVDGCGLMTDIPWTLVGAAGPLPQGRIRALGMFFVRPADREAAKALVEKEFARAGAVVAWRHVQTDRDAVLPAQRRSVPDVLQAVAAFESGRHATDDALYRIRLRIERHARHRSMRLDVVSLSSSTVVYKALVTPDALDRFYPDLADRAFTSRFALFHQRYSTNTSADWALAQPFRVLAHNGEINTIGGNRLWMRARLADETSLSGFRDDEPVSLDASDSRSLDDAVELLRHHGYSTAHALSRLVPPAWERDRDLAPDVRAFYEFQSLLSEPWDGPSALAFADGRFVGAALDRNGFRPARVVRTSDGLIAVASEVGVLPSAAHEIVDRGRLGPGDVLVVDLERGAVMHTNDVRRRLAYRRRYALLVDRIMRPLPPPRSEPTVQTAVDGAALARQQAMFGCTREEIELILKPMVAEAHEAVGSMGDDAPPALLSGRPRLFGDFFRQRFAQVTNPPVDPYRESAVMSLRTLVGAQGKYGDELAPRPVRIALRSPVLTVDQLERLQACAELSPSSIAAVFEVSGGADDHDVAGLARRIDAIVAEACRAVAGGSSLLVLTDRSADERHAPVPAVLATAAVHHGLIDRGLRLRASIVVDTGDARDGHQLALLCAYGASAVCPRLGYDTIRSLDRDDPTGCDVTTARYRLALERGLLTIMSKMGVCTFGGYCGAQLFETLGLDRTFVERFFRGTPARLGGVGLADLARTVIARHRRAFDDAQPPLDYPGLHSYRRGGEYHAANPVVVRGLHRARSEGAEAYATFTSHVYGRPPAAIRDLLEFIPAPRPVADDEVESTDAICRRFFASAMSVGALSPEAHREVARAMNRLGARSNSGEGGEEPGRGEGDRSRTRQIASARFGVTPAYLRSADELQIKIAQGSKPGEGGQLPAIKVVPHIAKLRHAQAGTTLISPPVHHDIYSIEDLAQLIFDLRAFHPSARINVKLVASSGVGIIATGVAKAGADAIQVSGHDGGTGASPRGSIKHAGLPWEIGVAEAHAALVAAGLRDRVVLQTDGGLKTGRDIAVAAALGADEYGFGTAALVALGCVMARQCHANTCPVGIATQRDDLRAGFTGTADMLVDYLRLVAGEVRGILRSLGLTHLGDLVGRADLLRPRSGVEPSVGVEAMLSVARERGRDRQSSRRLPAQADAAREVPSTDGDSLIESIGPGHPLTVSGPIANTDRAFGAGIAGAIAARCGDAGLSDGSVQISMTGSAGQSFGAFALPGMRLSLVGDANDGVGKAMHGGEIVIAPPARERGRARQVLVGNAALYGATGGRLFVGGLAGERFAVRNSGATAVVEGAGDHACEYMTGGVVVILGAVGGNFGAGMTGGVAYVSDRLRTLARRTTAEHLAIEPLTPADVKLVRDLIETHERLTGSRVARAILRNDRGLTTFVRVTGVRPDVEREAADRGANDLAVNE